MTELEPLVYVASFFIAAVFMISISAILVGWMFDFYLELVEWYDRKQRNKGR